MNQNRREQMRARQARFQALLREWPQEPRMGDEWNDQELLGRLHEAEQRFLSLELGPETIDENQKYHDELDINNKAEPLRIIDADQGNYDQINLQRLIEYDSIIVRSYLDIDYYVYLKIQALKSQALAKASETQKTALELAQQIATRQGINQHALFGLFCFAFMNDTQSFNDFKVFCHDQTPEQLQDQIIAIHNLLVFLPRQVQTREWRDNDTRATVLTYKSQPEFLKAHDYPIDRHMNRLEERVKGINIVRPVQVDDPKFFTDVVDMTMRTEVNQKDPIVVNQLNKIKKIPQGRLDVIKTNLEQAQLQDPVTRTAKLHYPSIFADQANQFKAVPQEKIERMRTSINVIQNRIKQYGQILWNHKINLRNITERDLQKLLDDARAGRNEDAFMRQCIQVSQLRLKIEMLNALISGANRQKSAIEWIIRHLQNRQPLAPGEIKANVKELQFNENITELMRDNGNQNAIRKLLIRPNTNMQNIQGLQKRVDFLRDEVKDLMKKSW